MIRSKRNGVAADQACGEQDVGNGTGVSTSARSSPENSSGSRPFHAAEAASNPFDTVNASASKPYDFSPAAHSAPSCGHTVPQW